MADIKHGIAGGLAGIAVDACFYPLETIKTRIMASSPEQDLTKIAKSRFKGFSCQMIVSFPYSFTFFYVYETVRSLLPENPMKNVYGSVMAEVAGNLVRNPFEIIKQQMMVGRNENIIASSVQILKNKGYRGFYIGYKSTLIRDIVFSSVQLPLFEYFREKQNGKLFSGNEVVNSSVSGMLAAIISGFVSCPLDVIKTRLMTEDVTKSTEKQIKTVLQIYRETGIKGYFKGVTFRCGILGFGGIIYFGALQKSRNFLGIH